MALPSNAHLIWHPFAGYCRHEELVVGVPTILGYIDFGVVNGITGMFAWPTAKFPFPPAREPSRGGILDMKVPMQGHGTDATLIVLHVPVPFVVGPLLALTILFGSSRIVMASHRTRIWCKSQSSLVAEAEQAVGCCVFPYIPLSLNLQCWEFKCKKWDGNIGAPVMSDVVVAPNTVQVGVDLSDYLAAAIEWGTEVAMAVLLAYASRGSGKGKMAKPTKKSNKWYSKLKNSKAGKKWAIGLGVKLPYKLLVKNTEWFADTQQWGKDRVNDGKQLL